MAIFIGNNIISLYSPIKTGGDIVTDGVYGAEWMGTADPKWVRTDNAINFSDPNPYYASMTGIPSSPFDDIMPWAGMKRVTDPNAGEVVSIPKFYFKWTLSDDTPKHLKLQISPTYRSDFFVSPAHVDRGDGKGERDIVYAGRYHCGSDYKSSSGVLPKVSVPRSTFRSGIHALGDTIWQWDYRMLLTIQMLYLVEFANWDSQAVIGYGCGNGYSTENQGKTNNMSYHTGTVQTNRTTYGTGIQYRYIEDLWANVLDWIDGWNWNGNTRYIIDNPSQFADDTVTNATNMGTDVSSSNYQVSEFDIKNNWYPLPKTRVSDGNYNTYTADSWYIGISGWNCPYEGGWSNQGSDYGLFCSYCNTSSGAYAHIGSRLMILP